MQTGVGQTWLAATASGLYRSTDLGGQWARVGLPAGVPVASEISTVASSPPSTSPSATVLVTVRGHGLLRSTNGGTWFAAVSTRSST